MSSTSPPESGFQWVLVVPDPKGYNSSKVDRRAIRRQAMKTVSARWRQHGDHGRINMGQYPVFTRNDNTTPLEAVQHRDARASGNPLPESDSVSNLGGTAVPGTVWDLSSVSASMPLSGIERLRAMSRIDLLSLSSLTMTHVGKAVSSFLDRPSRLVPLLRQKKTSYLSHIPSRIGYNLCLDHTIYALLSKA